MGEQKWMPKLGDHVYHVCEFRLTEYELRKKNLEGFKNWGLEVVESVITEPYVWKSRKGSALTGWASEVINREVGTVTEGNRKFYWKDLDFGRDVFRTPQEAMNQAEARTKMAESALNETRYERRPMYKNWLHWKLKPSAIENSESVLQQETPEKKRTVKRKPKAELSEELYVMWRDGKITTLAAAMKLGVSEMTFSKYAKEMLTARGEKHELKKPVSEKVKKAYERLKNKEIKRAEAIWESGLPPTTFDYQVKKLKQMEKVASSSDQRESSDVGGIG